MAADFDLVPPYNRIGENFDSLISSRPDVFRIVGVLDDYLSVTRSKLRSVKRQDLKHENRPAYYVWLKLSTTHLQSD